MRSEAHIPSAGISTKPLDLSSPHSSHNGHEINGVNGHKSNFAQLDLAPEIHVLPFQPSFPEWNITYEEPVRPSISPVRSATVIRTHQEEREQPYLLPFSVTQQTHELIADMEFTIAQWGSEDTSFGSFEKLRQLSDLQNRMKDIPSYVRAEDDPNLKMPNPLMLELMESYGSLHEAGKKDSIIRRLYEQQEQRYQPHRISVHNPGSLDEGNNRRKTKIGKRVRSFISFLQ